MNNGANFESKLWAVLVKEQLADLSQFHGDGFHEEVPLYSRESDIAFLSDVPVEESNAILLGFALKFLKSVVSYENHRAQYLAAITAWGPPDDGRVVPNLFVWSGPVQKLRSQLVLEAATTAFAKTIKQIVARRHPGGGFEVLQDTVTEPDETRVFISLSRPPYRGFVPLHELRKPGAKSLGFSRSRPRSA